MVDDHTYLTTYLILNLILAHLSLGPASPKMLPALAAPSGDAPAKLLRTASVGSADWFRTRDHQWKLQKLGYRCWL